LFKLFKTQPSDHLYYWIRSFLSNRSFFIQSQSSSSDHFPIHCGVPQGCVLSPLLFLLFINDAALVPDCTPAFFADDIALWPHKEGAAGYDQLQTGLNYLSDWADTWRLRFSSTKSNIVFFCHAPKANRPPPIYYLSQFVLSRADSYQYLGVHFSGNGSNQQQYKHVLLKAQRSSYLIRRLIGPDRPPSPLVIRNIINATIIPAVMYGMPFWRPSATQLHSLERLILWPIRMSLQLPFDTRQLSLFAEFKLLPLSLHRQLSILRCASFS
jgi:hypothetical protein